MPLSPKVRAANAAERAIHEGNIRAVVQLADKWGLPAGDRIETAVELHRRTRLPDPADVRTVSDVWRQGSSV